MIFLCHQILSDANRTQFNRVRFLTDSYSLHIVGYGPVSVGAAENAQSVSVFPGRFKPLKLLFPMWVLWTVSRLMVTRSGIRKIYSTYEPRILLLGFMISRLFGLEWIVDLWDDPEKMVFLTKIHKTRCQRLNVWLKTSEFHLAKRVLKNAHKVILGLVPGRVIHKYSLHPNHVLPVTNGINLNYPFGVFDKQLQKDPYSNEFSLFYCGTVDRIRLEGIPCCLDLLLRKIQNIQLVVVGSCLGDGRQWLEAECGLMGRRVSLEIMGRQTYEMVLNQIASADVCICPYPDKMDLGAAFPVKIFDYMVMGKPAVVSGLPGTRSIVRHGEDALVFEPGNYAEMADFILDLYMSKELGDYLSVNAKKNVRRFCWHKINQRISLFLEK
jgi:glycosyltransferase involved in cell wall biosynthesis